VDGLAHHSRIEVADPGHILGSAGHGGYRRQKQQRCEYESRPAAWIRSDEHGRRSKQSAFSRLAENLNFVLTRHEGGHSYFVTVYAPFELDSIKIDTPS